MLGSYSYTYVHMYVRMYVSVCMSNRFDIFIKTAAGLAGPFHIVIMLKISSVASIIRICMS